MRVLATEHELVPKCLFESGYGAFLQVIYKIWAIGRYFQVNFFACAMQEVSHDDNNIPF